MRHRKMNYTHYILLTCFIFAVVSGCHSEPDPPSRPNIVLIVADDFGFPYHGFLGAHYVKTPAIDALARKGTVFINGYTPANHCSPSLRSIITGLLPIQYEAVEASNRAAFMESVEYQAMNDAQQASWKDEYRFHSMKDIPTLARILAEHGYLAWQGGKWWEFNYQNGGFTHGMTTGWNPEDRGQDGWFLQYMGGAGRDLARSSNQAAFDFIDMAGDTPFFMWYAPELPHYPFDAPQKYYDIYAAEDMSESANQYFANASWFDEKLGEFLTYLEEKNKRTNTILVYVNDNGWEQDPDQEYMGDPLRYNNGGDKGKLGSTDLSFRTPIIFSWPGQIDENRRDPSLIHAADIPPTILDMVGIEPPEGLFGQTYRGVLTGPSAGPRSEIVGRATQLRSESDVMGRPAKAYWIRRGDWFFSWDSESGEQRLYNVQKDPREDTNQADENPDLVTELRGHIQDWRIAYEK